MRLLLLCMRLFTAVWMVSCATIATRSGCGGDRAIVAQPQPTFVWAARHDEKVSEAKRRAGQVDLLFVGDSITQNYERTDPDPVRNYLPVWKEMFAPRHAMNLGFEADRTYNVLWRLRHGEVDGLAPKSIVLLIGTNNFNPSKMEPNAETAVEATTGVLAVIHELHTRMPDANMLVLSILPSGFGSARSAKANETNSAVRDEVAKLEYARYLDVGGYFLHGNRLRNELFYDSRATPASPSLHPTPEGQRMMAEAVMRALDRR